MGMREDIMRALGIGQQDIMGANEQKAAFDAEVARQVAVLEAAKKIVDSKK